MITYYKLLDMLNFRGIMCKHTLAFLRNWL